jgi:diguanylate cyclase (GGDEF)-like protein
MNPATPLLDRVADLSAIRDADLLDLSLLRTVQDVCAPQALALLRIAADGATVVETRLSGHGCQSRCLRSDEAEALLQVLPPPPAPALAVAWQDGEGRPVSLYPMMEARGVRTLLQVSGSAAGDAAAQALVVGFARFFHNYRGLLDDAQRDALTGLRNRKTFEDMVLRLVAAPDPDAPAFDAEGDRGVWLGILDIDHFKRINDGFGHLYGDEVLLLVAQLMQRSFRGADLLFRFGGEEFVVVVDNADQDEALAVFERFREAVAEHDFPQVGKVTVSIGIVALAPGRLTSVVLDEADKALYWAKQHGRNRAVVYEQLVASGEMSAVATQTGTVDLF